jgi:hypothetical protein
MPMAAKPMPSKAPPALPQPPAPKQVGSPPAMPAQQAAIEQQKSRQGEPQALPEPPPIDPRLRKLDLLKSEKKSKLGRKPASFKSSGKGKQKQDVANSEMFLEANNVARPRLPQIPIQAKTNKAAPEPASAEAARSVQAPPLEIKAAPPVKTAAKRKPRAEPRSKGGKGKGALEDFDFEKPSPGMK